MSIRVALIEIIEQCRARMPAGSGAGWTTPGINVSHQASQREEAGANSLAVLTEPCSRVASCGEWAEQGVEIASARVRPAPLLRTTAAMAGSGRATRRRPTAGSPRSGRSRARGRCGTRRRSGRERQSGPATIGSRLRPCGPSCRSGTPSSGRGPQRHPAARRSGRRRGRARVASTRRRSRGPRRSGDRP